MDGLRDALEYAVEMSTPTIIEVNGKKMSNKRFETIERKPVAEVLHLSTLTSLVEYIKNFRSEFEESVIIHVESPTRVKVFGPLNEDKRRELRIEVNADVPFKSVPSTYSNQENFRIYVQTGFTGDDTDKELILRFCGTVQSGTIAEYSDDGVSQKASVKTGIASKSDALVPSPVALRPFSTFLEVEQPKSYFIFRMRESSGIECALFRADGGMWERTAMDNIVEYLKKELKHEKNVYVIS